MYELLRELCLTKTEFEIKYGLDNGFITELFNAIKIKESLGQELSEDDLDNITLFLEAYEQELANKLLVYRTLVDILYSNETDE